MMKNPESHDPRNTKKPAHQCPHFPRRFSPYTNTPSKARELRPIGAELKFHGDAGDYAQREVDAEDLRPEARRFVVGFVASPDGERLEHDDQRCQTHRELRE